nr:hypothetical protein [uncultured Psychroserpens sp.]
MNIETNQQDTHPTYLKVIFFALGLYLLFFPLAMIEGNTYYYNTIYTYIPYDNDGVLRTCQ